MNLRLTKRSLDKQAPESGIAQLWRYLVASEFARFCIVGTIGFVVDTVILYLLLATFVPNPYLARLFSYLCAATANWILNRNFTFSPSNEVNKHWEWSKYIIFNAIGGGLNYGTFAVLIYQSELVSQHPILGVVAGSAVGLAVNYSANKFIVFKSAV